MAEIKILVDLNLAVVPYIYRTRKIIRMYAHARMNVDHVLLGRGLSRTLHLNLTDSNLTVASPTAKPPNLIDR